MISFVVLTMNGKDMTKACLESLLADRARSQTPSELILVDNGSTDGSEEALRPLMHGLAGRYVRLDHNVGAAAGRSLGTQLASGDLIVYLDNDTRVAPGIAEAVDRYFSERSSVGGAALKVMRARAPQELETTGNTLDIFGFCYNPAFGSPDDGRFDRDERVLGAVTAGLAIRARAYSDVGGFRDEFFYQYEDTDLCWRIWLAGWEIGHCWKAKLWHLNGGTIPRDPVSTRYMTRNRLWALEANLDGVLRIVGILGNLAGTLGLCCILALRGRGAHARAHLRAIGDFARSRSVSVDAARGRRAPNWRRRSSAELLRAKVLHAPRLSVLKNLRFMFTSASGQAQCPRA